MECCNFAQDQLGNTFQIVHQFNVSHAQNLQAKSGKILISGFVVFLSTFVTFTIQLNDKIKLAAVKVYDIGFYSMLTPKFQSAQLFATQYRPQLLLRHS